VVVAPGASPAFLAPQPVAWLGETGEADAELVGLFARLGLSTLGALGALTGPDVAARFGPPGRHAHRLASGVDDRPSRAEEPPVERAVERMFDDPVVTLEPLVFVAKQLADELIAALAAAGSSCVRLAVTAETEHGERSERVWYRGHGLSAPAVVERARWQLEGWMTQPGGISAGVVLLRLDPVELRPAGGDQLRLWGGLSAADERAARTVARLAGLVGEPAVQVPAWQGGRLPGHRYRWVPATTTDLTDPDDTAGRLRPPAAAVVKGEPAPWPGSLPAPSPSLIVDGALVAVVDEAGQPVTVSGRGAVSAPPATLVVEGRPAQPITAWAGPWPIDERWWDEGRHRRLARFQVVTADGAAHLVAVEQQRWRLLATYA
jgi:protein ImuB